MSDLQYWVLATNLFLAAKGPAEEAARKKMAEEKKRNGHDPGEFIEVPFKETGVQYVFYICHEVEQLNINFQLK